jgi:hypothetical protein
MKHQHLDHLKSAAEHHEQALDEIGATCGTTSRSWGRSIASTGTMLACWPGDCGDFLGLDASDLDDGRRVRRA